VLHSIEAQGRLTPELRQAILEAATKTRLEDLYRPYMPKRRTQAQIAREAGLVGDPTLVLLDEPTGQLDAKSSQDLLALLGRLNTEFGKTILLVTHDAHAAETASTVLHLDKGELVER